MNKKLLIKSLARMTTMYLQKCEEVERNANNANILFLEVEELYEHNKLLQADFTRVSDILAKELSRELISLPLSVEDWEKCRNAFERMAQEYKMDLHRIGISEYAQLETQAAWKWFCCGFAGYGQNA
jgi:uncharacterized protein YqgQ